MVYQFFHGLFIINKYGTIIFILMCTLFADLYMLLTWGPHAYGLPWGPHIYFIIIWSDVVGWECVIQYPINGKPSRIPSRKCNNCIWASGVRKSLPKYLRDIISVKTEKFKLEHDKFLELIPDEPKMPNYVTAAGSNSILDQLTHLRAQGIY